MEEYKKIIYDYFKQLVEFLEENENRYNYLAKNCPKEERKELLELTLTQCKSIINYFEGSLIKPGFYFYSIGTIEIFLQKSHLISETEIYNLLYEFLKSDAESVFSVNYSFPITVNAIYNLKQCGINIASLKNILDQYHKDKWPEIIIKLYPRQYDKILKCLMQNTKLVLKFQEIYQTLKLYLFDKKELSAQEKEIVKNALKVLQASDSFIEFCFSKKLEIKPTSKEKTKKTEKIQSFENFRSMIIPGLKDKEWKELEKSLDNYYNSNPIRSLDIIEKIELITILLKLNYSEEDIKKILHENDRHFYQESITNQESNSIRNTRIIYLLMKNAYKSKNNSQNVIDFLNEINHCKESEKESWIELTKAFIEEETREYIKEIKRIRLDVCSMPLDLQKTFRDSYIDNLQKDYGNTYLLINQIREQYKKSTGKDRIVWKKCLHDLLKRLVLEQFACYEMEILEAKKIVTKEFQNRAKKY